MNKEKLSQLKEAIQEVVTQEVRESHANEFYNPVDILTERVYSLLLENLLSSVIGKEVI